MSACAEAGGEAATGDGSTRAAAATVEWIEGTPAGGLEEWVLEIEVGLADALSVLEADLEASQRRVLDLYVGRQEYIEMYWGAQGRLRPEGGMELEREVLSAESGFHDLLTLLSVPPVDRVEAVALVDTVNARLSRVLAEAKRTGAALVPPAGPRDREKE